MNNRIDHVFAKNKKILCVYYTAGFPRLNDTFRIAQALEAAGVDMIEIGIPFSDPIADGSTIQKSSQDALANGMSLSLLFEQLAGIRKKVSIPILLMGYFNSVLLYGVEKFCDQCLETGLDGMIVPDLPMNEYGIHYQKYFQAKNIYNIFLISPSTSESRIRQIYQQSDLFIYMVSQNSITGTQLNYNSSQNDYFQRVNRMRLNKPLLIGFGISDKSSFANACRFANGGIVGSAFIRCLEQSATDESIRDFVGSFY